MFTMHTIVSAGIVLRWLRDEPTCVQNGMRQHTVSAELIAFALLRLID